MKIVSITWNSYIPLLLKAGEALGLDLKTYSSRTIEDKPEKLEEALKACENADIVLLYYTSGSFWDELGPRLEALKKNGEGPSPSVVCTGHDPYFWTLSSVDPEIAATSYLYFAYNGEENLRSLLNYLRYRVCGEGFLPAPPKELAWDGLFHPKTEKWFSDLDTYLDWYGPSPGKNVGILISRTAWVNRDLRVESSLIRELENRGLNVIPVFAYSLEDRELGTRAMGRVIEDYFMRDGKPIIDCLIKLTPFLIEGPQGAEKAQGGEKPGLLKTLDVPLLQPIVSSYMTVEEWESSAGLGNDIAWYVAMPEFEGAIEPLIIGGGRQLEHYVEHVPIEERCARLAARVLKLLKLREKPASEKTII
ncbi:MAG: cobaltochelatase subunit CobN [Methanosarcinaceae archaeon]|nr:cobaltochelatase subunit CobN [Methanosarcinaceae archaeon]